MIEACKLLVLAAFSSGAFAAQAPAPPAVPAQPAAPQPAASIERAQLGRLFFTPTERTVLDDMRRRPSAPKVAQSKQEKPPLPPAPEFVTLNGVVRRSDGTTTVWLNNKPVRGRQSEEGLVVSPSTRPNAPGAVTVRMPESGRSVDLKVGQQVEVNSGRVAEAYRAPRRPATTTALPAAAPAAESARTVQRRPSREREILRDLLREIDDAPAGEGAAPAAPSSTSP